MPLKLGTQDVTLKLGSQDVTAYLGAEIVSLHPEAVAWRDAVVDNGGSVSGATLAAVSDFCTAIDAAGIRDRFYRLNLFCGNSDASLVAPRVPLYRGPSLAGTQYGNALDTNNNFVQGDYAETGVSGGLLGNGSSKYLATGLASDSLPSILSAHMAVYMRSNTISATTGLIAADDGTDRLAFFTRPTQTLRGTWAEITNSLANNEQSFAPAFATGLYTFTRTAADESVIYQDATAKNTNAVSVSPAAIATPWHVFASNVNGVPSNFSTTRLAGYSIGTGMSSADMTAYNTAMTAFQAALTRTA